MQETMEGRFSFSFPLLLWQPYTSRAELFDVYNGAKSALTELDGCE